MHRTELIGYLLLIAVVLYAVGRLLVVAFFAAKRRHVSNVINDLLKGEPTHGQSNRK